MSANNCYVIKYRESTNMWYGWDEMAEESLVDENGTDTPVRVLHYSQAPYYNEYKDELIRDMRADDYLDPEYGFTTDILPKDGTPIKFEE